MTDHQFDSLITGAIAEHFAELTDDLGEYAPLWVRAQIWQESRFDPGAVSHAGAAGLMQLMPGTARELGVVNVFSPAENIDGGVRYLAQQYRRLSEIHHPRERLRFSLAAYNGGRGYINAALELARQSEGQPASLAEWRRRGCTPGWWQTWQHASKYLRSDACQCHGKRPDWRQMTDYVQKIEARYSQYLDAAGVPRHAAAWG